MTMDTIALQDVYQRLMASVAHARFSPPTDSNEWSVELVLAHVIATNRTLSIVGVQILDGREATYEGGTLSVSPHWLESIVEASEGIDGLLAVLHQSSEELLALTRRFDDDAASKMFPATIYDGHGKVLSDGPVSFSNLLTKKLVYHLSLHIEQIRTLEDGNDQ
jgi:hypothetical protein